MNKFVTFLFGGAIGACAALLLAPRSGAETRNLVADQANNFASNAQEASSQMVDKLHGTVKKVAADEDAFLDEAEEAAQQAINTAAMNAEELASFASDRNDQLRAKIEETRARIKAQINEKAKETAKKVDDDAPEAKKKAEEVVDKTVDGATDKAEEALKEATDATK